MSTTNKVRKMAMAVGVLTVAWLGCRSSGPSAVGGGPPGAQASIDDGAAKLSLARCEREERCGHVGSGQTFETREKCMTVMRGRAEDDLELKDCRGGIDQREMDECLNAVKEDGCGNPIDKLGRMKECRSSEICFH